MSAAVFAGPTLSREAVAAEGDFVCLPPAAQGDVYRAVRQGARVIGIVDGYFSGAPAVWHKEILWAMSEGVAVFGSASIGALRAAELDSFGMRGIGRIYEAYRDGILEDDDEVAVLHGPAELDYLALSEPMVNIRATLAMAERSNILGAAARESLERRAKELFFGERRWQTLLTLAPGIGVPAHERQALTAWLPGGHVDQKRLDALAMLNAMRNSDGERALGAAFQFDWTFLWDEFVGRSSDAAENPLTSGERILEELRLLGPEAYHRVEVSALLRAAAVDGARGNPISGDDRREWLVRFRAGRALFARADLDRWMAHNDLTPAAFETMIDAQARLVALRRRLGRSLDRYVLDELRLIGDYPALADRARRKNEAAMAADRADLLPQVATAAHLRLWYFEQRLHRSVPDDLSTYSSQIGFADPAAFDRALYRERLFLDQLPGQP